MASILLSTVGPAVGVASGIPFGGQFGTFLSSRLGSLIDGAILPGQKLRPLHGPRLASLAVQSSTYGKMIPIAYGRMRLGGNIIWSQPIREISTTTTSSASGGKGGGGRVSQTSTTYSYSITLAVAICEGPVDAVLRIWADARQLDLSQHTVRIYKGDEEQLPDSLIQAIEGAGNTPAYRGLAYVVFEDFPMADYGNRIPNFSFEVQKKLLYPDYEDELLENMITGMVMIPGGGEFVYDTEVQYKVPGTQVGAEWVQQGSRQALNMHNPDGIANALVSLNQLKDICPNVAWVSVVVSWFGTSMDAGDCIVAPGVEYQSGAITSPATWQVAGYTRATAHQITLVDGRPHYGGTPDDASILHYLDELKSRGYNIAFYPLLFMDVEGKPWRGELTGSAANVADFFTKTNGYNAFITHYASLVAEKVDAFIIGSELKGLTKVTDTPGSYPAVDELVDLAATVKAVVGSNVKVTYAADWSEYHHTDGGWYNLDPLWASDDIDVIGIDAYFPLSNVPQSGYDIDTLIAGWTSGEGYDFYYTNPERTVTAPLDPPYAWKSIAWFWENTHTNPDSSVTDWVPESKKIWFTEFGFPSVDGAANQPNIFFDPESTSGGLPYFSKGRVDLLAQRAALTATLQQWKDSAMVERMFLWTWDARPFPYWPDLTSVWTDGEAWQRGHWVQGKLGTSSLAAIIADLCSRAGLNDADIHVGNLASQVEGFVISEPQTVRQALETLQSGFFFDVVESDNILKFVPRGGSMVVSIAQDNLVPGEGNQLLLTTRTQEIELPRRINVVYITRLSNYQGATQYAQREVTSSLETFNLDLPIVCSDQVAKNIADISLFSGWMGRTTYRFELPIRYARLEPSDVIEVTAGGVTHRMRITATQMTGVSSLIVQAVAEDISTFDFYAAPGGGASLLLENQNIPVTQLALLDLPAFPGDDANKGVLRIGGIGLADGWKGAALYRSDDGGSNYGRILDIITPMVTGTASNTLGSGATAVFDENNTLTVILLGNGELQSVSELAVLNGANVAVVGSEIIQFRTATLVEPGKYSLSGLLRGRLGTEWAVGTHAAGERFVLLDGRLTRQTMANNVIGLSRHYKPVTFGSSLSETAAQSFAYGGIALKPYSPVHIMGERDGSDNLTISWVRRTRLGGDWQDGIDVPLNETAERYEVDIMDGSDVMRTISGLSSPTASYSAAEQTADFGSAQASVDVRVYQLSGIIGRGYAGEATV